MSFNPATDFVGLWRATGPNVAKLEMPALDFAISALARAGVITLAVAATQPVVNQSITAWLRTAVPSWSAEGAFFLWDKVTSAYLAATPALFLQFLEATAGENGSSIYSGVGGPPLNTVGINGDFYVRTDEPGGIYGPKAAGAWPPLPVPGTLNTVSSLALDNTFGTTPGAIIRRGALVWEALPVGAANEFLTVAGGLPDWNALTDLLDTIFSNARGSLLYRAAGAWTALAPGVANQVLATGGPGADPAWAPRTAEFASGTVLLFYQAAAPTGWTQNVALNDYGLRVVSGGGGGAVAGSAFSTVFAQTTVGNHTLTIAEMPSHTHSAIGSGTVAVNPAAPSSALQGGGQTTGATGGGGAHNHTVNLTLAYVDVIIASKN